jgi:hypothetical protein
VNQLEAMIRPPMTGHNTLIIVIDGPTCFSSLSKYTIPRAAVLQPAHVPRTQDVPVDQLRMPDHVDPFPQRRLDYLHPGQPLLQCEGTVLSRTTWEADGWPHVNAEKKISA